MNIELLTRELDPRTELPVEIGTLAELLIKHGFADRIDFKPVAADPTKLRGLYLETVDRDRPYSDPIVHREVLFTRTIDLPMQRLICAKELVHVCENVTSRPCTAADVVLLTSRLCRPLEENDRSWLTADIDRIAVYKALCLLVPEQARLEAAAALEAKERTIQDVADWAHLPLTYTEMLFDPLWPQIRNQVIAAYRSKPH